MQTGIVSLLAASVALGPIDGAWAQDEEGDSAQSEEITVIAPRPITPFAKEKSDHGAKPIISLKMLVQYGDLDLSQSDDVARLAVRVHAVARDACRYLDQVYPLDLDPDCESRAVQDAKPQVAKAIAAAVAQRSASAKPAQESAPPPGANNREK